MTAFLWAACLFVAAVWAAVITYLWRTRDRKPLSVPGRDAPARPAPTGPSAADPQWWLKGGPGIPAGGSNVPPGDTAVPAPASLPEGDEPAARPPQEAPAREPSLHAADHMRAEIWATRPWADDTGTFAAIVVKDEVA